MGQHLVGHQRHELTQTLDTICVQSFCLLPFTQPYGHHLHEATFVRSMKIGMGFDPIDDNGVGGGGRHGIGVHRHRAAIGWQLHHVHGRADVTAHSLHRHAVRLQHLLLTRSRGPTVATHGRHQKRHCALCPHPENHPLHHRHQIGNSARTNGNGDLCARCDGHPGGRQRRIRMRAYISDDGLVHTYFDPSEWNVAVHCAGTPRSFQAYSSA